MKFSCLLVIFGLICWASCDSTFTQPAIISNDEPDETSEEVTSPPDTGRVLFVNVNQSCEPGSRCKFREVISGEGEMPIIDIKYKEDLPDETTNLPTIAT